MFANLIKTLCGLANVPRYAVGEKLGYKTPSAFQKVTTGKDIRLSVFLSICLALGYTVTVTNDDGVNINLTDLYKSNADTGDK